MLKKKNVLLKVALIAVVAVIIFMGLTIQYLKATKPEPIQYVGKSIQEKIHEEERHYFPTNIPKDNSDTMVLKLINGDSVLAFSFERNDSFTILDVKPHNVDAVLFAFASYRDNGWEAERPFLICRGLDIKEANTKDIVYRNEDGETVTEKIEYPDEFIGKYLYIYENYKEQGHLVPDSFQYFQDMVDDGFNCVLFNSKDEKKSDVIECDFAITLQQSFDYKTITYDESGVIELFNKYEKKKYKKQDVSSELEIGRSQISFAGDLNKDGIQEYVYESTNLFIVANIENNHISKVFAEKYSEYGEEDCEDFIAIVDLNGDGIFEILTYYHPQHYSLDLRIYAFTEKNTLKMIAEIGLGSCC